jgi:hypothetical protein
MYLGCPDAENGMSGGVGGSWRAIAATRLVPLTSRWHRLMPIGPGIFEPLRRSPDLAGCGSLTVSPSTRPAPLLVRDEIKRSQYRVFMQQSNEAKRYVGCKEERIAMSYIWIAVHGVTTQSKPRLHTHFTGKFAASARRQELLLGSCHRLQLFVPHRAFTTITKTTPWLGFRKDGNEPGDLLGGLQRTRALFG